MDGKRPAGSLNSWPPEIGTRYVDRDDSGDLEMEVFAVDAINPDNIVWVRPVAVGNRRWWRSAQEINRAGPVPVTIVRTALLAALRAVEVGVATKTAIVRKIRAAVPAANSRLDKIKTRELALQYRPLRSVLVRCRAGRLCLHTANGEDRCCTARLAAGRGGSFEALVDAMLLKELARLHPARELTLSVSDEHLLVTGQAGASRYRSRLKCGPAAAFPPLPAGPETWQSVPVETALARLSEEKLGRHLRRQAGKSGVAVVDVAERAEWLFFKLPAFELAVRRRP